MALVRSHSQTGVASTSCLTQLIVTELRQDKGGQQSLYSGVGLVLTCKGKSYVTSAVIRLCALKNLFLGAAFALCLAEWRTYFQDHISDDALGDLAAIYCEFGFAK